MIFKANWETAGQCVALPDAVIDAMISRALPGKTGCRWERLGGGCANLSILIRMEENPIYVLRVYLRDKEAACREHQLAGRFGSQLPVPQSRFIGTEAGYDFALIDYCRGINLREALLGKEKADGDSLFYQAGVLLGKIQAHRFNTAGFFDRELRIKRLQNPDLAEFVARILTHPVVLATLPAGQKPVIAACFSRFAACLPDDHTAHLVHGDYDPANLLVDEIEGKWQISAVLDWEFAFAGSPLWDVATMLRYAHAMPTSWTSSFVSGLQTVWRLPNQWQTSIHLLNLASLLDCLSRTDPRTQPRRLQDILALIDWISGQLSPWD